MEQKKHYFSGGRLLSGDVLVIADDAQSRRKTDRLVAGQQITLKPCPFCGSTELVLEGFITGVRFVRCDHCGCYGPDNEEDTAEKAVEAWNKRHEGGGKPCLNKSPAPPKSGC